MGILFHRAKRLVLIVVGTAALAGGPVASVASAQPKDAGAGYDCEVAKNWFDQRMSDYYKYFFEGHLMAAAQARQDAMYEKGVATQAGCDTSGWIVYLVISTNPNPYSPPSGTSTLPTADGSGTTAGSVTSGPRSGSLRAQ